MTFLCDSILWMTQNLSETIILGRSVIKNSPLKRKLKQTVWCRFLSLAVAVCLCRQQLSLPGLCLEQDSSSSQAEVQSLGSNSSNPCCLCFPAKTKEAHAFLLTQTTRAYEADSTELKHVRPSCLRLGYPEASVSWNH